MRRIGNKLFRLAALVVPALWFSTAPACNVPVFRYALERWQADPYQVVVFHDGPLTAEQEAVLAVAENTPRGAQANLTVTRVNTGLEVPRPLRELWAVQEHPTLPWMAVRYPKRTGIERSAWAGPLGGEAVRLLIESPVRQEIAKRLLNGEAIVWLLLESGDRKVDDETERLVDSELRKLEKSLALPVPSPADPPIDPELPLKIAFSSVRVARFDPAEHMLVSMLLNWNTNLVSLREPMLFPIFGRGRVIPPAVGQQIRAEAIQDMAEFLTGPCSCEVKEMNPGYDLLLAANWDSLNSRQESLSASPPLTGVSQFAADAATNSPALFRPAMALPSAGSPGSTITRAGYLLRNLIFVVGIGLAFVAVTTLVLKIRSGRERS